MQLISFPDHPYPGTEEGGGSCHHPLFHFHLNFSAVDRSVRPAQRKEPPSHSGVLCLVGMLSESFGEKAGDLRVGCDVVDQFSLGQLVHPGSVDLDRCETKMSGDRFQRPA
jgi:hypothetical protein